MAVGDMSRSSRNGEQCPDRPHGNLQAPMSGSLDELTSAAASDPYSRALAIALKCLQCRGSAAAIRECPDAGCALYRLRPYQIAIPKPAPRGRKPAANEVLERLGEREPVKGRDVPRVDESDESEDEVPIDVIH